MIVEVHLALLEVVDEEHLAVDVTGKLDEGLALLVSKHVVASFLSLALRFYSCLNRCPFRNHLLLLLLDFLLHWRLLPLALLINLLSINLTLNCNLCILVCL